MPARRNPRPEWVLDRRVTLGRRIAELRHRAGLSQDQLAERAGIDRRSVQRYEHAARDPQFSDLLLIASVLRVPIQALLEAPGTPIESCYMDMPMEAD
ncbi:helix-turn-helix transcriptional regulator [Streptomyces sp. MJP52]|uniref:helix-turn-helix domain-containing protein n=1 Tax=Streptomyces sp. MJP52 TaxID=2940555 RepID=UPI002473B3CD|nr:helix-turn-helix transcriptional regulator [Streptomyces sp. MJP52]MDH6224387.1 transcriptional regulator with XRE-family HTH domain [Streptomyces sp. MJP52]